MKTKLLALLFVALVATVPTSRVSAAPALDQRPQVIITVDYDDTENHRPHLFYSICDYLRSLRRMFMPCRR